MSSGLVVAIGIFQLLFGIVLGWMGRDIKAQTALFDLQRERDALWDALYLAEHPGENR